MSDGVGDVIAELWERNRSVVFERVHVVRAALVAMTAGDLVPEQRDHAQTEAHKLAGALGMYGFANGSVVARRAEEALGAPPSDVSMLLADLDALEQELHGGIPGSS